jgi:hypothetical protein
LSIAQLDKSIKHYELNTPLKKGIFNQNKFRKFHSVVLMTSDKLNSCEIEREALK